MAIEAISRVQDYKEDTGMKPVVNYKVKVRFDKGDRIAGDRTSSELTGEDPLQASRGPESLWEGSPLSSR